MNTTRNHKGTAAAKITTTRTGEFALQVQARDAIGGNLDSATAHFSREELEHFRDLINTELARTAPAAAEPVEVREVADGTWYTYPGRANSVFIPND